MFDCFFEHTCYLEETSQNGKFQRIESIRPDRSHLKGNDPYYQDVVSFRIPRSTPAGFKLGYERSYPGYTIKDRCENTLILNYVISGSGTLNGISFGKGQFFFQPPRWKHTLVSDSESPWESIWIMLRGSLVSPFLKKFQEAGENRIFSYKNEKDILSLAKFYLYECTFGCDLDLFVDGITRQFLSYIEFPQKSEATLLKRQEKIPSKIQKLLAPAFSYVQDELAFATVEEAAARVHLERKYFSRIFLKYMGITPSEYISNCRLQYVCMLLSESSLSIGEISEVAGYMHRNGLNLAFKKNYGMSPMEYRKIHTSQKKEQELNS